MVGASRRCWISLSSRLYRGRGPWRRGTGQPPSSPEQSSGELEMGEEGGPMAMAEIVMKEAEDDEHAPQWCKSRRRLVSPCCRRSNTTTGADEGGAIEEDVDAVRVSPAAGEAAVQPGAPRGPPTSGGPALSDAGIPKMPLRPWSRRFRASSASSGRCSNPCTEATPSAVSADSSMSTRQSATASSTRWRRRPTTPKSAAPPHSRRPASTTRPYRPARDRPPDLHR